MNRQFLASKLSLTSYLDHPCVRTAWRKQLPRTKAFVLMMNKVNKRELLIPPSTWVREHQRYGCLGTAYDYLVGAIWARKGLQSVFDRVEKVSERTPRLMKSVTRLKQLLAIEKQNVLGQRESKKSQDFYRALGGLADLDAMFRAPVPSPAWVYSSGLNSVKDFRAQLRRHYPDEFVRELKALFAATVDDLPRYKDILYNPAFGGWVGTKGPDGLGILMITADGDLILGDMLLDLKVSVDLFSWDRFWQLLGYAALDRAAGRNRIKSVGLYNPRYGVLWHEPVEDLIQHLGGGGFEEFWVWFTENADKIMEVV